MRACKVVGPMWATVKHPAFVGKALFIVQPINEQGLPTGASFVAVDNAQAGVGDTVLNYCDGGSA